MRILLLLPLAAIGLLGSEELFDAARKGDVTGVKTALDKGVPVETTWRYGQTALFIAASRGHTDVVRLLVERGAKVDIKDTFYGMTALGGAAQKDNVELVTLLLDKGAAGGDQVLTMASSAGKTAMVKALVDRPGWKAETLTNALSMAEANKREEVIVLLKAAGARPRPLIQVDPGLLQKYAGRYKGQQFDVAVAAKEGVLMVTMGQQTFECRALDQQTFEPVKFAGAISLRFQTSGDHVTGIELRQGPQTEILKRVEAQ